MKLSNSKALVFALALLTLSGPAFAHEGKMKEFDPDRKAQWMKKELSLSDDQTAKIKAIYEKNKDQREQSQAEVSAVLTDEQRAKLETLKKEKREKVHEWKEKHEAEKKD